MATKSRELSVGEKAPSFELPDHDGKLRKLSDYKGKWVVLYFYPKDMTSGCTLQACGFSEELPAFSKKKAAILGVSKDSVERHLKFKDKYGLGITLLSDEDGTVCKAYGVIQKKKLYGREFMGIVRTTYLISPDQKIARVFPKVKVKGHIEAVLDSF